MNQLTCHYCGYTYQVPKSCPACGGVELVNRGFGTEEIEDDIATAFPEARVARMDLGVQLVPVLLMNGSLRILKKGSTGHSDRYKLMVSKGLDFDRVVFVGIRTQIPC